MGRTDLTQDVPSSILIASQCKFGDFHNVGVLSWVF